MPVFARKVKILAIISFLFLSIAALYWLRPGYEHIAIFLQGKPDFYVQHLGWAFWTGTLGYHTAFLAGIIGAVTLLLLELKKVSLRNAVKLLSLAVFFEAIYFASFPPYFSYLERAGQTFLAYSYLLQGLAATPILIGFAIKFRNYDGTQKNAGVWKWAVFAFAGFILALWGNMVMGRWFDMLHVQGIEFLQNLTVGIGFFTSSILMSLAVGFAVIASVFIFRGERARTIKFVGLALLMVGVNYVFYALYCYSVGLSFGYLMLVDTWTIVFVGLGAMLLIDPSSKRTPNYVSH